MRAFVVTRDEEGDVASLVGPFASRDLAYDFVGKMNDQKIVTELTLAEVAVLEPFEPGEYLAEMNETIENLRRWWDESTAVMRDDYEAGAIDAGACPDDPDGLHHVGCGHDS